MTCHDGFTLNDLVSYVRKHNEANGEDNRDGTDANLSWNCGVEGPTQDPTIERLRNRQVKNFLAITLLSLGTPMLSMGDEVRRTQRGNNNAYYQDNEISWFHWSLLERHRDIHRFVKQLIGFRLNRNTIASESSMSLNQLLGQARVQWHGVRLDQPDWSQDSHSLAATARIMNDRVRLHLMLNAYWEALEFEILPIPDGPHYGWRRGLDTGLEPPKTSDHARRPRSSRGPRIWSNPVRSCSCSPRRPRGPRRDRRRGSGIDS